MAKNGHGGAREGAGRKHIAKAHKKSETKFIRCSPSVNKALDDFMGKKNSERKKVGLPPVSFSHWAREILLVAAGREDLTEAANPVA